MVGARIDVVIPTVGRPSAVARNVGRRAAAAEWIVFLDEAVVLDPHWAEALQEDLSQLPAVADALEARA